MHLQAEITQTAAELLRVAIILCYADLKHLKLPLSGFMDM